MSSEASNPTAAVSITEPSSTTAEMPRTSSSPNSAAEERTAEEDIPRPNDGKVIATVSEEQDRRPKQEEDEEPKETQSQQQEQEQEQEPPRTYVQEQRQHDNKQHITAEPTSIDPQRPPSATSVSMSSVTSLHTSTLSTAGPQQHLHQPPQHYQHQQLQHHAPPPPSAQSGLFYNKMSNGEQMGVPRGPSPHYPRHGHHLGSNPRSNYHHESNLVRPTGRYPVPHGHVYHGHAQVHPGHPGRSAPSRVSKHHQLGQYPSHHYQQQYHSYQQAPGSSSGLAVAISRTHSPVPPSGVSAVSKQQQPSQRLPNTSSVNNVANPHENLNQDTNTHGTYPSNQQELSQPQQHHQYAHDSQQQVQIHPSLHRPSQDIRVEQYPPMHQGYQSHQQHDHYGGQPMMHEMHYNYHHAVGHGVPHTQGYPGTGIHHQYRGQHNGYDEYGSVSGYPFAPGGHREVQVHPQHSMQGQYPQHHPRSGHGFQLPKYNASRRVGEPAAASRSPTESPPPGPPAPSAQALLRQKLREQETKKLKQQQKGETSHRGNPGKGEPSHTLGSIDNNGGDSTRRHSAGGSTLNAPPNKPPALGDRGNMEAVAAMVKNGIPFSTTSTSVDPKMTEDPSMDAASILLALGGGPRGSVSGGSENQNPGIKPPIPSSVVQRSTSMEDDISDAGTMLTMQTEAPDLTSGPSSDSIDMETNTGGPAVNKVPETAFPCKVPDRYPTRLSLPYDASKLNTLHCFLRSELLEIFCITKSNKKSPCHSPSSSVGRVGLRCVHCAMARGSRRDDREDAPMAVFYPKSIAEIYRLVTSWQRCHLRKCRNVPPAARARWQTLRDNDKSRGKTHYWVTSAKQIGLMDCHSRAGGIRFAPDFDPRTLPPETILTSSIAAIAAKAAKICSIAAAAEEVSNQQGASIIDPTSGAIISDNVPDTNMEVELSKD